MKTRGMLHLFLLGLVTLLGYTCTAARGDCTCSRETVVYYVQARSTLDPEDGLSWATSFQTLHAALTAALPGDEIWVASGLYWGTHEIGEPEEMRTIKVRQGVTIRGGFAGYESAPGDRPARTSLNETRFEAILDGTTAYRVVEVIPHGLGEPDAGCACNMEFDRITIADGLDSRDAGGTTPIAPFNGSGAGMLIRVTPKGSVLPTVSLTDVRILNNESRTNGAGVYASGCHLIISGSEFDENVVSGRRMDSGQLVYSTNYEGGGLFYTGLGLVRIQNTLFQANVAQGGGGAYLAALGGIEISQSSFVNNWSQGITFSPSDHTLPYYLDGGYGGALLLLTGGAPIQIFGTKQNPTIFIGNGGHPLGTMPIAGGAINASLDAVNINWCVFEQNVARSAGGAVSLQGGGSQDAVNLAVAVSDLQNCLVTGGNRISHCQFLSNATAMTKASTTSFGGALFLQAPGLSGLSSLRWSAVVDNCYFAGNLNGYYETGAPLSGDSDYSVGYGGAAFVAEYAAAAFINCAFHGNHAFRGPLIDYSAGGAIATRSSGRAIVWNSSIVGNYVYNYLNPGPDINDPCLAPDPLNPSDPDPCIPSSELGTESYFTAAADRLLARNTSFDVQYCNIANYPGTGNFSDPTATIDITSGLISSSLIDAGNSCLTPPCVAETGNRTLVDLRNSSRYVDAAQTDTGVNSSGCVITVCPHRSGNYVIDVGPIEYPTGDKIRYACVADYNQNGIYEYQDILDYIDASGMSDPCADMNGNGVADTTDIFIFLNIWFAGC